MLTAGRMRGVRGGAGPEPAARDGMGGDGMAAGASGVRGGAYRRAAGAPEAARMVAGPVPIRGVIAAVAHRLAFFVVAPVLHAVGLAAIDIAVRRILVGAP